MFHLLSFRRKNSCKGRVLFFFFFFLIQKKKYLLTKNFFEKFHNCNKGSSLHRFPKVVTSFAYFSRARLNVWSNSRRLVEQAGSASRRSLRSVLNILLIIRSRWLTNFFLQSLNKLVPFFFCHSLVGWHGSMKFNARLTSRDVTKYFLRVNKTTLLCVTR